VVDAELPKHCELASVSIPSADHVPGPSAKSMSAEVRPCVPESLSTPFVDTLRSS